MQKRHLCATALALAACAADSDGVDNEARKRKDAGVGTAADAAPPPPTPDAATPTSGTSGSVSCYTRGAPDATCSAPDRCCFTNYTADHNGYCTTDGCSWGTLNCDGPEDCGSGSVCCATMLDYGWDISCRTSCDAAPPRNEVLCHSSDTCSGGTSCVSAYDVNYDFPRTLSVCR